MRAVHRLPLAQLDPMTLSYVPRFAITYLFWWIKPKDVLTSSVVELLEISEEQRASFESRAVSHVFYDEGMGIQASFCRYGLSHQEYSRKKPRFLPLQDSRELLP